MMEIVEDQIAEMEQSRREVRKDIGLMIATGIFAFTVVWFVSEPSVPAGAAVMCSLLGYAAVMVWASLADRLRCTKRYG